MKILTTLMMVLSTQLWAEDYSVGTLENDIQIARVYESVPFTVTINKSMTDSQLLIGGVMSGNAELDPFTGRIHLFISSIHAVGQHQDISGWVIHSDGKRGIPACTHWQTRMFEDEKLCYEAELRSTSVKVVYHQ